MAAHAPSAAPTRLRITNLKIRGYRALRRVDWPEDGLGWNGQVPDTILIGGINGSGKTTLLELIFDLVSYAIDRHAIGFSSSEEIRLELDDGTRTHELCLKRGVWIPLDSFVQHHSAKTPPSLLYFPTDRTVSFPSAEYKHAGTHVSKRREPIFRYHPNLDWDQSIEALLYDARWRDLNAKERGNHAAATHFAAYATATDRFFGKSKSFEWDIDGVLHIKTADGTLHPLDALSSGEKQILLFAAELYRRWTPGSLVLIDEPELHLHESWLATLWRVLAELQRERGGQLIVTTQSDYLFSLGEPGSRVLLGGGLG